MKFKESKPLYKLAEIAEKLRAQDGCPWDRKQTMMSLRKYAIEEAYEVQDAIESGNTEHILEELGDLFYQTYAQAQIAKEDNLFEIDDIANAIIDKLIRRHPHVFGNENVENHEEVSILWENIKKEEKKSQKHSQSILDGVPRHLPALLKAYRIQEKTSRIGFDWSKITDVEKKLDEEVAEFKDAIKNNDKENLFEEFGDILFTLVNMSRFLKIDPEEALQNSSKKFIKRFKYIEKSVKKHNKELNQLSLEELDELWKESKRS
jgi:tetrapyrrole methylase family protein/MazG family protein